MPILRGHHLICLHFFHGEGYDKTFIRNLKKTMDLAEREPVTVSSGADDVCRHCVHLKKGRCESSCNADKTIEKMDIKALALIGNSVGDTVTWAELRDGIKRIFPEWYFQYCTECEWKKVCEHNEYYRILLSQL